MTTTDRSPDVHAERGNAADSRYLARTIAALADALEQSDLAAVHGRDTDVRALARRTRSVESRLLREVADLVEPAHPCLAARPEPRLPPGLDGSQVDRQYVEMLSAHAHTSLGRARAEMVDGVEPGARHLAEEAIRVHSHELAEIDRLAAHVRG